MRRGNAKIRTVSSRARWCRACGLVLPLAASLSDALASERCEDLAGRLVSVEGEVRVAGAPARMEDEICAGERIEVGSRSRVALRLETTQTVVRIDQNSVFVIEPSSTDRSWLRLLRGVIYLFSRRPETLRVDTPYVNAAIDGTELVVDASEGRGEITVIEGRVRVGNAAGEIGLEPGQTALARSRTVAPRRVAVDPQDAVRWALHYPPIGAVERTGDETRRAAELLATGDVDAASTLLDAAPEDAASLALRSMIAVTRNRASEALGLAERAVDADPGSSIAYTALSYVRQARFDIDAALESARRAVANDPRDAHALARRAELELGVDDAASALASAREAVRVDPANSRARTALGFVRLIRLEAAAAERAFAEAVARDPGDPFPRLGLGLATIRDGRLVEGREHIEVAASLDPNDALVRSYLGKAYFEERQTADAAAQLELAKSLDPEDPTAWFYDALLDQALNRPVDAFRNIERARALNDNRLVYQSRLLVDKSDAAGSLGLARIYTDLGFEQPAIVEGTRSIEVDPTSFSAHRFLADGYASRVRHESARENVLFQAALLQPMTNDSVRPYVGESDLLLLSGSEPTRAAINEYSPLFDRQGHRLSGSLSAGNEGSFGNSLFLGGSHERLLYSLGRFSYATDGFRENADIEHDIYHAFVQAQPTPRLFLQAELRSRRTERGDLALNFDPDDFSRELRVETETATPRVGLRAELGARSTLLVSASLIDRSDRGSISLPSVTQTQRSDVEGNEKSIRLLYRGAGGSHALGVDSYDVDVGFDVDVEPCDPNCPPDFEDEGSAHASYHYYAQMPFGSRSSWTLGLRYESFDDDTLGVDERSFGPRLGARWRPTESDELRLAVGRGRKLPISRRLEPVALAGFNQLYDDAAGTRNEFLGLAYDRSHGTATRLGMALVRRELDVPRLVQAAPGSPEFDVVDEPQRETTLRGYFNHVVRSDLSLGIELLYERFERDDLRDADGVSMFPFPLLVETVTPQLKIRYAREFGFFAQGELSFVRQAVDFAGDGGGGGNAEGFDEDSERFLNVNLSVGFRLPSRRAIFRIDVFNVLDESFLFQDHNIQTQEDTSPRFSPGRFIVGRASFSFR